MKIVCDKCFSDKVVKTMKAPVEQEEVLSMTQYANRGVSIPLVHKVFIVTLTCESCGYKLEYST